jgi:hypothetical protein
VSQAALIRELEAILSGNYDPVAAIVQGEKKRKFRVVRPGDEPWFLATDWKADSVASIAGNKVRLVLLSAIDEGTGSFTRTVKAIEDAGFQPVVIEPTFGFAAALKRRGCRKRTVGSSFETFETTWKKPKG